MHQKVCSKCKIEKEITAYNKSKYGKYGVRSICNECNKMYVERPEIKERIRIRMAEWRKANHEKALEIQRKCCKKNAAKYNEKRRWLYQNDEEYKNKRKEADKKYRASGRRNEVNRQNPKHRERAKKWAQENPEKVKKKMREYRDRYWNAHQKQRRKHLDDSYVIVLIKKQTGFAVKTEDIPKKLIDLKRQSVNLKRELKNKSK